MYSNESDQIGRFEKIKKQYDPDVILRNPFSDTFFQFGKVADESDVR